jgi:hypothetical protein
MEPETIMTDGPLRQVTEDTTADAVSLSHGVSGRLKSFGASTATLLGIGLALLVPIVMVVLFFKGALWAAEHLLPWLVVATIVVLMIDLGLLLPLSVIRPFRGFTGGTLIVSSYVLGLTTWLVGFVITFAAFGVIGVLIGFLVFGVGVVPLAMIAALIKGNWGELALVIVLMVATFGIRLAGAGVAASAWSE